MPVKNGRNAQRVSFNKTFPKPPSVTITPELGYSETSYNAALGLAFGINGVTEAGFTLRVFGNNDAYIGDAVKVYWQAICF